jgi:holliday junction DNA helicase RuvA
MISLIEGTLEEKSPTRVVLLCGGVGYELSIPLSSYDRLPDPGAVCRLRTVHHVREDAQQLFGFATEEERVMFQRLLGISGIGPKLALSALSSLSVRELTSAVVEGDIKRLSSISGIGKKVAERIVVELRDRIPEAEALAATGGGEAAGDERLRDAVLALISLGYKQADARAMLEKILTRIEPSLSVEDVVRMALTR